ncbi:MAG TPA: SOS response-associated peptidase [Demequinaceae bacterium]
MCARYANFLDEQDLLDAFAVAEAAEDARLLPPSWNIGPMHLAPIVALAPIGGDVAAPRHRRLIAARWGLVPTWAKDSSMGAKMFNARSETVTEKPSFRAAFAQRRCLVPASGYYEWQARKGGKQPYFIYPEDASPLAFAGLWETRKDSDVRTFTFSILTTAARGGLAAIHDRQPVMLRADERDAWMDVDSSADELMAVMASPSPAMAIRPVGKAVGNIRNDDPSLVTAVAEPATE